jgi:hypothetical protein
MNLRLFLSPHPGRGLVERFSHGFTVGYYRPMLRSFKWILIRHSKQFSCPGREIWVSIFALRP